MYEIEYHEAVLDEDFKGLSLKDIQKVLRVIENKLVRDPEAFGKPLRGELKGYWRLRIDHYRVIYRIAKRRVVVQVIKLGLRKDCIEYIQAAKRLGLI